MPYLQEGSDEEELKKQQEAGNPTNISGQSTVLSQEAPSKQGGPQASGSFTNLNQYLDANKETAPIMGGRIADDISQSGQEATTKIQSLATKAPEVKAYDPNNAYKNVVSLSDQEKKDYHMAKEGYSGPKNINELDGYQETQKKHSDAWGKVQNASSDEGRFNLLKSAYARPTYSQGQQNLDNLLITGNQQAKSSIQGAAGQFAGLNKMLEDEKAKIGTTLNRNVQTGYQNQQAINAGDATAKQNLLKPIQQRADQANQNNQSLINSYRQSATSNAFSADELGRLGLSNGQNIYDMDLSGYLQTDASQVGLDNAATADERARYAALTALIDGQTGQAITANGRQIDPVKFDKTRFETDRTAKDTEYKNAYANQRGTALNAEYLMNPAAGFDAYIPGAYTDRRDLSSASPQELETYWLPIFQRAQAETGYNIYGTTANAIQRSVAEWKNKYKSNRTIGNN